MNISTKMNYKEAVTILGLPEEWNHDMLKKAYRKGILRYHPDKNKSTDASFQFNLVKRAFEYLTECKNEYDYTNINEQYMGKSAGEKIDLTELFNKLQAFDNDKLNKLFGACKEVVGITKEMMGDILTHNHKNEVKYEIEVKLSQMLNDEVYVLKHNDISLLVPLWFDDVYYEKVGTKNENVSIKIIPQLTEGVIIKENNHIVVKVNSETFMNNNNNKDLFDVKQFQSPNSEKIDIDLSKMKKGSKLTLWNVGLLKVFEISQNKMNTTEREGVTFIIV